MGFFDKLRGGTFGPDPAILQRIAQSECGQAFAEHFRINFASDSKYVRWLMAGKKRHMSIKVQRNGILLDWIDLALDRYEPGPYGSFVANREGWGFGSQGYADLPNDQYALALQTFLLDQIQKSCPSVVVNEHGAIMANEAAKKGW